MPQDTEITEPICAVVITCNPPPALVSNVEALKNQVARIIIVDNGTPQQMNDPLEQIQDWPSINIIRNGNNRGIAVALNIGIQQAISLGFKWVATFDHDSLVTPGYFPAMFAAYRACSFKERVPLIAPRLCYSPEESANKRIKDLDALFSLARTAMTSGSLIRTDIFGKEGFYDESFFMDYVDYDFCLRLWKHGWKVIRANQAHLLHRLGVPQTHSIFGLKVRTKSHNPWRRYYIMRNRMIVFQRYAFSSLGWCLYDFFWIFLELTKIVLFEKEKAGQLRATIRGLWHGLIRHPAAPA